MAEKSYNEVAANWWATQIRNFTADKSIHGIDKFEETLANQIKQVVSVEGHMRISSCPRRNQLLNNIAFVSHLSAIIPTGYEMMIFFDKVFIYNQLGQLVNSF